MAKKQIPTYDSLMNPMLTAMKSLGGSGTVEEIFNKVVEITGLTDEQLGVHKGKGYQTEVEYRLAWARTWLKKYGVLENSARGVWALTAMGSKLDHVDEREVLRVVRAQFKVSQKNENAIDDLEDGTTERGWRDDLLDMLMKITFDAFERLTQRVLRESGFTQVEVTGKSGDNGIDGKGIMRLGGLLSFHVLFQCKRYQGSVSSPAVRNFRGAMEGRADKGLLITTGSFTRDAVKEATRDGASPIDLVDGDQFVDLLKNLGLGVKTRKIEREEVTIDKDWFSSI